MDYGSYRASSRISSRPAVPTVPVTMSTGIPLNERFRVMQEQKHILQSFAQQGYGLPGGGSMARYGGGNPFGGHRAQDIAVHQRASALALARQPMVAGIRSRGVPVGVRNRGRPALPVKARLGIPRKPLRAGVALVARRRGNLNNSGRGTVLNRVQKTGGAIVRKRGLPVNAKPLRAKGSTSNTKISPQRGNNARGRGGRGGARGGGGGGGATRGGRGGGRGGRGRGGPRNQGNKPVKKEDLDTELEEYMAKSKSYLDKELDDYMNQKKAEAAAVNAGTVVVEDADITMSET